MHQLVFNHGSERLLIVSELSDSNNLFIFTVNVILSFQKTDRLRLYAALWISIRDVPHVTLETWPPTGFPTRM